MISMSRNLLVALAMALLVPLQGLAAATAGVCMAMGHHDAPQAAVDHEHGDDHGHSGAAHDGPQASHEHEPGAQDSSHCGPCVACCASASIAPQYSVSLAAEPAAAPPARTVPAVVGAVLQQLDRPPLAL